VKILFLNPGVNRKFGRFILFSNPIKEIVCLKKNIIKPSLQLFDKYIEKGYYAAGFLCYETGGFFNEINLRNACLPYFYFGIYKKPEIVSLREFQNNKDKFVLYDLKNNTR